MLLSDQPLAVDLAQAVGDAQSDGGLRVIFGRDIRLRDAVRVGQFRVGYDTEVLDFKLIDTARKGREEVLIILLLVIETNVLARRRHVENKQLSARRFGIYDFTFEGCSSFTRVKACQAARPRDVGFLPRLRPDQLPSPAAR